ncbi:MAG: nitrite reductase small subunit NirD [Pseudanabaena sp. SU_2_4]|nr:nitrite reductase small subunit NirD [Pseudanabaena sp. SU_2_4]
MIQTLPIREQIETWTEVCALSDIAPNTGVCALVETELGSIQVAVFRFGEGTDIFALSNYDPFSKAYVLSRGLVGDRKGTPKVASPIYKQNFNLLTGQCLDDETVSIPTFPARLINGRVQVAGSANS